MPITKAEEDAVLSRWEISADFVPPSQEHLQLYLVVKNSGAERVAGVQLSLAADSLEYVETEQLSFEGEKTSNNLKVTVGQAKGKGIITVMFPRPIEKGYSQQALLDFKTKGLLRAEGDGYVTLLQFDEPQKIMENGAKSTLKAGAGSIRVHVPEGYIHTKYSPNPWREIWQGVSGFKVHYILVFNGGTPITSRISVSFKESPIVKRAVELYGRILETESAKGMPQQSLDDANRRITEAATYLIYGDIGLAEIELDKAESIITGKPLESISIQNETGETSRRGLYGIGIAFVLLVLISLKFGKDIIATIGGKKSA